MTTTRPNQPRRSCPAAGAVITSAMPATNAEWIMASLVLVAIAISLMSSVAGFADAEGKEKNGVRRAASQLERKVVKLPALRAGQVRIG